MTADTALPLAGIRVLDFSHAAAGPYATMLLGDLGAEIVKVERKGGGDAIRGLGTVIEPGVTEYFAAINRNKRCLELDLNDPAGVAIAHRLVETCDVVVQNFRPGVADRLGIGFESLSALRKNLVYASISGFGNSGPWRDYPANDIIVQSASGLMGATGEPDGPPLRIGASLCDFGAGLFMSNGLLAALIARDRFPEGQHVEVAMLDASFALLANFFPAVTTFGRTIPRPGRAHPQIVPYQAFETSDGHYLMVGAFTEAFWRRLARMLGHEEWIDDPRFALNEDRVHNRGTLAPLIEAVFRTRTRDDWLVSLRAADIPSSAIYDLHEAVHTEQAANNNVITQIDQAGRKIGTVSCPVKATQWPPMPAAPAPALGADSVALLQELLGMPSAEIDLLIEAGTVGLGTGTERRA